MSSGFESDDPASPKPTDLGNRPLIRLTATDPLTVPPSRTDAMTADAMTADAMTADAMMMRPATTGALGKPLPGESPTDETLAPHTSRSRGGYSAHGERFSAGGTTGPGRGRSDSITQSLTLLVTMLLMMCLARFAVPSIVEEMRFAWYRGELRAEYEAGTAGLQNVSLDALSDAYEMVTAAVGPSVVHIDVQRVRSVVDDQFASLLSRDMPSASDQGSGVIVDDQGHILTNRHVIADGQLIFVTLSDGRRVRATLIGADELTDLAILKIDADKLIPIQWGDSDRCRVGSPLWAVGSPFGLDRTVTFGILSGKHRMVRSASHQYGAQGQYQDFMQSDVAVNPGNSGGPLVDVRGKLVGINTAIVGDTYQGVSFSIPSNVAKVVYERIRADGYVQRGWLGVELDEVPDELVQGDDLRRRGAMVAGIARNDSPAKLAGMRAGDIITSVDDQAINDVGHLMRVIGGLVGGTKIRLDVWRGGRTIQLDVKLGLRPQP